MSTPSQSVSLLRTFAERHQAKEGRTLVVGSRIYETSPDRRSFYADAFGIDMLAGDGVDYRHDLERPLPGHLGKFDHVDLCSVLEHVRRPWLLAANVEACMVEGATILVSVPFVWRIHAYPSDYWRMTPEALDVLFPRIVWKEKKFIVGNRLRKRVPGTNMQGETWIARAETVAFGCLTS